MTIPSLHPLECHRTRMLDDPLWIDISGLMIEGQRKVWQCSWDRLQPKPQFQSSVRLCRLTPIGFMPLRILDVHVDEVTGEGKSIDVVVDIFNRINRGDIKLIQGDLTLAKAIGSNRWIRAPVLGR